MANFLGLGQDTANVAKMCAENNDRAATAAFLIMQQDAIQANTISERKAAKNANGKPGAAASNNNSGKPAKKSMDSIYAKLMGAAKESK